MSETNGVTITEVENNEEVEYVDIESFLEQDKRMKELQEKLTRLREDNKKQIDTIINSLDQLMLDKNEIENSLREASALNEKLVDEKHLSVVDIISSITGYREEENMDEDITANSGIESTNQGESINEDSKTNVTEAVECNTEMDVNTVEENNIEQKQVSQINTETKIHVEKEEDNEEVKPIVENNAEVKQELPTTSPCKTKVETSVEEKEIDTTETQNNSDIVEKECTTKSPTLENS